MSLLSRYVLVILILSDVAILISMCCCFGISLEKWILRIVVLSKTHSPSPEKKV